MRFDPLLDYDLRGASFEELVNFFFDRDTDRDEPWYYDDFQVIYDASEMITFYTTLFSDSTFLLERFSKDQLERGFWAISGCNLDCNVAKIIGNEAIPFELRSQCMRSMYFLYRDFFNKIVLKTSCDMWWDNILYVPYSMKMASELRSDQAAMQPIAFETLALILELDSIECYWAALHGLNHLRYSGTKELVHDWLSRNRNLSCEVVQYARYCIHGKAM